MNPSAIAATTPARTPVLTVVVLVLLIVGGLNWALVGLLRFDLVAALFGNFSLWTRIVYVLVGVAALYTIFLLPRLARLS
jgi:uncharacterized membrane protein YuzA (DUF378 family)